MSVLDLSSRTFKKFTFWGARMGGIVRGVGETLGLVKPKAQEVAPEYGQELFQQSTEAFKDVGNDPALQKQRELINKALEEQLGQLEDNAAGRKQMFQEDMSRQFSGDVQNLARARGGTGTLASALRPSGNMYDSQARATSRGLNDLYGQALNDLGSASNIRGDMYGQDMQKAAGLSGVYQGEAQSRRQQANTNADNRWNANQARNTALSGTLQGAAKAAGAASSPNTFMGKAFG